MTSKDPSTLRVLFLSGEAKPSDGSRIYRCTYQAAQIVQAGGAAEVAFVGQRPQAFFREADVIVLSRCTWNADSVAAVREARAAGKWVCADLDDRIFCPWDARDTGAARTSALTRTPGRARVSTTQRDVLRLLPSVDETLVSTPALRDELARFGLAAHVSRNAIDSVRHRPCARTRSHLRKVLFMTGTRTHDSDLLIARSALLWFFAAHPDVSLTLLGPLTPPSDLAALPNVSVVPKLPLTELYPFIADHDACVVPLEPTAFNECKSALKFIECGLVSVPVIASDRREFAELIQHGENGVLARDGQAFGAALRQLYDSPDLLARVVRGAYESVMASHTVASRGAQLAEHFVDRIARGVAGVNRPLPNAPNRAAHSP